MFRLYTETDPKVVPSLHYPINPFTTHSLYRLVQKLSPTVSRRVDTLRILTYITLIGNYSERTKTAELN